MWHLPRTRVKIFANLFMGETKSPEMVENFCVWKQKKGNSTLLSSMEMLFQLSKLAFFISISVQSCNSFLEQIVFDEFKLLMLKDTDFGHVVSFLWAEILNPVKIYVFDTKIRLNFSPTEPSSIATKLLMDKFMEKIKPVVMKKDVFASEYKPTKNRFLYPVD